MNQPLLITVAPTGAETAKADCPQLPTTLEELVATAVACEAAGAAMIHVHIRDDEHRPTLDGGRLKATVDALRESTSLVVQLSTGGSVHDPLETRLKVLDAEPDSCSLTMGTTNFGDDVFSNPWPFVTELYQLSQEREVVPEFELFDLGQVHALSRLLDKYGPPYGGKVHCDLVMGVPGGMNGTADALVAAVRDLPPSVTSWSATGIGRSTLNVMYASLSKGGHLRVGMEDVLTISRGVPVESNAQLVERAVEVGRLAQRTPMTTTEARELLGVKARSVDQRLHAVGEDLLGERRRAGDPYPGEQVPLDDAATLGALGAHRHLAAGDDGVAQVRQGRGQVEGEGLGPARYAEPCGLAGQPQADVRTRRHRGRRHRERLVAALGVVGPARHLHDQSARHAPTLGRGSRLMACCAPPHGRSAALPSLVDGPAAASLRRLAEHPAGRRSRRPRAESHALE